MYQIFSASHLLMNKYLGYFHFGAITKISAINIYGQVFVWTYVHFSWIRVESLDPMIGMCLMFYDTANAKINIFIVLSVLTYEDSIHNTYLGLL